MSDHRNIFLAVTTRVIVCLAFLIAAVGIAALLIKTRPEAAISVHERSIPRVLVMQAAPVPVARQWVGYGTARAMDAADVPARVTATVVELPLDIDPGRILVAGQLIARLDDSDFARQVEISTQIIRDLQAQLNRLQIEEASWQERVRLAEEEVVLARAEFDRVQDAERRGAAKSREVDLARQSLIAVIRAEVGAREEFDKLPARRASLQAQLAAQDSQRLLATQNLERCRIIAPIDGILEAVDVKVGENIMAGARVARIVNLSRIEVPVRLPAAARLSVRLQDTVTIHATGEVAQTWDAHVARVAPEDDAATRTIVVFVELQQKESGQDLLTPGRFVRATIREADATPRWVIPRRAIQGDRILLIHKQSIVSRSVEPDFGIEAQFSSLGVPDTHWVVLKNELNPGDLIVLTRTRSLRDGAPAEPVTQHPSSADEPIIGSTP